MNSTVCRIGLINNSNISASIIHISNPQKGEGKMEGIITNKPRMPRTSIVKQMISDARLSNYTKLKSGERMSTAKSTLRVECHETEISAITIGFYIKINE
ncbi:unnamed protein product [Macrosiphum euphorbiae]|uniref:Uncharacterized protein n=1 Tax=Macrosiphum euphorbiae TaxID=13131 RepID=A0AAV0X916_9HEMI|nr:unnamed protein product [Macrosiphum euphorbiae]